MPISSFMGLQTSLRGLLAQQRALDVAGHNIANANTEGYSRQEAVLAAAPAYAIPAGATATGAGAQLGSGVDIGEYRRMRDGFLDLQFRAQTLRHGEAEARSEALEQAEVAFAEPGASGISAALGKLWSAFGDLANAPESQATRQALVGHATSLASQVNELDAQLATLQAQAGAEYAQLTAANGEVDGLAREVASLNGTIRQLVEAGQTPNDLLDRRDGLLDRLAELGRVSVTDNGDGTIDVAFGGAAVDLVAATTVTWPQALSSPGGRLGALADLSSATGPIGGYRDDLDAFARSLADTVNAVHGAPAFFSYTAGTEAATLAVAVTPATVRATASAQAGANEIAIALAGLRGGTADTAYSALVSRVGTEVAQARREADVQGVLEAAIDDRRLSTSGVSLDEEMSSLIRFQRGYQASARAMSTMDELLDVLINRTGRVGL